MTSATWIAAGVGTAALVGAIGFSVSAYSVHKNLKDDGCETMPCAQARIDRVDRRALYADLLYGAAAAAGVTAVIFYLRSGRTDSVVGATPAGGGATVWLGGTF